MITAFAILFALGICGALVTVLCMAVILEGEAVTEQNEMNLRLEAERALKSKALRVANSGKSPSWRKL